MANDTTDGTIIEFLHGEKSYEGVWFGEKHPTMQGSFWWRKFLREFAQQFQQQPVAEQIYSDEEVQAAKETRNKIIEENIDELKAIYMAGEICMWDEMKNQTPTPVAEIKCGKCGCNKYRQEHDYNECINCGNQWFKTDKSVAEAPVQEQECLSKPAVLEQCRQYAESKMSDNWNREYHIEIGIFYKHFIDKLYNYAAQSTPVQDQGFNSPYLEEIKDKIIKDIEKYNPIQEKNTKSTPIKDESVWDWVAIFYGALKELVDLKALKETLYKGNHDGKEYAERKPLAWYAAKQAVELWKQSDYGAKPLPTPAPSVDAYWVEVPVSERLPVKEGPVMAIHVKYNSTLGLWYKNEESFKNQETGEYEFTHWLEKRITTPAVSLHIEALKQIEQFSDSGSYESAIVKMKAIATKALSTPAVQGGYSKEQVADTWDASNNFAEEQAKYPYGKRDGIYKYPNKEQYIFSLLQSQPTATATPGVFTLQDSLVDFLNELTAEPYPEDVFLPIPTNVLEMIHSTLMEEYKMPLDRLTGHIGRRLRKPLSDKATIFLNSLKQK